RVAPSSRDGAGRGARVQQRRVQHETTWARCDFRRRAPPAGTGRVEGLKGTGSHWRRAVLIVGAILGAVIVARAFGFTAYLRFENLSRLTETIEGHGVLG